jgi:hypothetical protein
VKLRFRGIEEEIGHVVLTRFFRPFAGVTYEAEFKMKMYEIYCKLRIWQQKDRKSALCI